MTYTHAAPTPWAPHPKLHKPGCKRLAKAREIVTAELVDEQAKQRQLCRYCFPTEGEDQGGR